MAATHRIVNGQRVELTKDESAAIEAGWAANPPPTAQQQLERVRAQANATLDQLEDRQSMLLRALVLTLLDELNLHAAKMNAILTAIDSSTNYATLKSNIAAVADYPARTARQVRTTLKGKVTAGDADS